MSHQAQAYIPRIGHTDIRRASREELLRARLSVANARSAVQ